MRHFRKNPYSGHSDKRNCSESQGALNLKYVQLASLGGILQIESRNQPFLEKRYLITLLYSYSLLSTTAISSQSENTFDMFQTSDSSPRTCYD